MAPSTMTCICGQKSITEERDYCCQFCKLHCNFIDGILDLANRRSLSFEFGLQLPARDQLRQELVHGVEYVIDLHAKGPKDADRVRRDAFDLARGNWQALGSLHKDAVILDFGCGLGAVSRSLARSCKFVFGADACYERLMINAAVNNEQEIKNIQLLCATHEDMSYFHDKSFDGICLNGILEWIPEYTDGAPRQVQMEFLRECLRILKPQGWLYIGIENRFGFPYFLGMPDDHSHLLYGSLLPRWLANRYSMLIRGRAYRTYTYSARGIRKLVQQAGFQNISVHGMVPSCNQFELIIPLQDNEQIPHGTSTLLHVITSWKQKIVEWPPFFHRFVPCFGVLAYCGKSKPSVWLQNIQNTNFTIEHLHVKHDRACIWYKTEQGQRRIRELALSKDAKQRLSDVASLVSHLRDRTDLPSYFVDWSLQQEAGYVWSDRAVLSGKLLVDVSSDQTLALREEVCRELRRLHALGKHLKLPSRGVAEVFEDFAVNPSAFFEANFLRELRRFIAALDAQCSTTQIFMHGDCTNRNILLYSNTLHFIDWEFSRLVNFPGFDIMTLLWQPVRTRAMYVWQWDEGTIREKLSDETSKRYFQLIHPEGKWEMAVASFICLRIAHGIHACLRGEKPSSWISEAVKPLFTNLRQVFDL